jgi:hypothetical protein
MTLPSRDQQDETYQVSSPYDYILGNAYILRNDYILRSGYQELDPVNWVFADGIPCWNMKSVISSV